jgi:hypothetical protein
MTVRNEDLSEIERAGRRCGVCRSGRGWRRFEIVRPSGGDPVVLCGSCRHRFGDDPPIGRPPSRDPVPAPTPSTVQQPSPSAARDDARRSEQHPDRLRVAMGKMPGLFSTGMVAREAGLNNAKALARLQELERSGEVRRVGKRWSTASRPQWIGLRHERATCGSCGNHLGSADRGRAEPAVFEGRVRRLARGSVARQSMVRGRGR